MLTKLYVSAQVALPDWARGRGLAVFLTFIFRSDDRWQRGLGETLRHGGRKAADRLFRGRGGTGSRHSDDLKCAGNFRQGGRDRFLPCYALARAHCRPEGREQPGAGRPAPVVEYRVDVNEPGPSS